MVILDSSPKVPKLSSAELEDQVRLLYVSFESIYVEGRRVEGMGKYFDIKLTGGDN